MKEINVVVMFPYPSGDTLHIGHYYNYALIDSYCRFKSYQGYSVRQPFGYDAFGLPAENYAREIGGDPREITYNNIERFRRQMERMNTRYEERLITADESYQQWTQYIFTLLYTNGLVYKDKKVVPYCPVCLTVLANEQVRDEHCDRCGSVIDPSMTDQWFFRITDYKDRLLKGLETVDYPQSTIRQQRTWLNELHDWCVSRQRKWGCPIPLPYETDTLDTFVDSSFYFLRYLTDSTHELIPREDYRPIDLYVGGREHACAHLIYARFIHYFLYDMGIVPQEEPFNRVIHQGVITKDGAKMAKSKGNTVNPDDYDPNELRLFLMFIGPYVDGGDWNDQGIVGIRRFLKRFNLWLDRAKDDGTTIDLTEFIDKIARFNDSFKFNRIVSSFMEFYNAHKNITISKQSERVLTSLLSCFAPNFRLSKA